MKWKKRVAGPFALHKEPFEHGQMNDNYSALISQFSFIAGMNIPWAYGCDRYFS